MCLPPFRPETAPEPTQTGLAALTNATHKPRRRSKARENAATTPGAVSQPLRRTGRLSSGLLLPPQASCRPTGSAGPDAGSSPAA